MIIDIHTEILPEGFRWDPATPVTGTTKFYVRLAEAFDRKGHSVNVVYDGRSKLVRGVTYWGRDDRAERCDLVLDCNIQRAPVGPMGYAKRFQWTSFYNRPDTCVGHGYDRLFLISEYHHSTLLPHVKCPVSILPLGCDFPVVETPNLAKRSKRCAYTSAPDRGANFLIDMWPDVKRETGYDLAVAPYQAAVSDEEIRDALLDSRFWLHPALGVELYCLSAVEAQACGCIPFYVPHMALPETCRYGETTDLFKFKEQLIETLKDCEEDPGIFAHFEQWRSNILAVKPIPTWDDVAQMILKEANA
jgi:hypothetical protein